MKIIQRKRVVYLGYFRWLDLNDVTLLIKLKADSGFNFQYKKVKLKVFIYILHSFD